MLEYPVELTPDAEDGGFVVTFPDVSAAITQGDTEDEALKYAVEALETALENIINSGQSIPIPSASGGRKIVSPSPLSCVKIAIYQAMQEKGVIKAELARRLGWHPPQVDRLLDLNHASKFDQLESALEVLGKRVSVTVVDAA
ncbi:MAG: type II toxin-antitoxin system HicB family antitoxin [Magnetococcales bacterium]|nr:type II toxin-antitoxin system HicB family antitoxin [Magnetococcales bacterium]